MEKRGFIHYAGIRSEIRDGDILQFRGKSWFSRLICWVTRSPYSHSAVAAWWNERLMVLEAVGKGVRVSRLSIVVDHYSGQVELWTTDEKLGRTEVIRAAQRLLGKRYSSVKLIRNLKRLIFGRPRQDELDPDAPPDDFVCSEFVSRVWRAGGIDLVDDAPDVYTEPSDIAGSPHLRKVGGLVRGRPAKQTATASPGRAAAAALDRP